MVEYGGACVNGCGGRLSGMVGSETGKVRSETQRLRLTSALLGSQPPGRRVL